MSYVALGIISASNGFQSTNWSLFGLTILFTRVFSGLIVLDYLVKLVAHIVATCRRRQRRSTTSSTSSIFLEELNSGYTHQKLNLSMCLLLLALPFFVSVHVLDSVYYLDKTLPHETITVWGSSFIATATATATVPAVPVTADVQFFSWLFGDLAPCSLLLGAVTYFPDQTIVFKNISVESPKTSFPRYPFDHQFVEYNSQLKMDIYYPKAPSQRADGTYPIFLYYHGGGWRYGDRKRDVPLCTVQFLIDRGIAFVSVDYRLLQHGFNGSHILEDAFDAVRFLKTHGHQYLLDGTSIVVSGNSAGGHLAMMSGYVLNSSMVSGVVTLWGVEPGYNQLNTTSNGNNNSNSNSNSSSRSSFHGNQEWMKSFYSPTNHINTGSPPTLLIHGGGDTAVSVEQSRMVANQLQKYKIVHQLVVVPAQNHACDIEPFGPCFHAQTFTLQYFLEHVYHKNSSF